MKVLNLDKLAKTSSREVVIFGKNYAVDEMTVENFIETTSTAERLSGEASLVKQVEATVDMIVRSIPTVDRADLMKLSLEQLQAIVAFVRGDNVEGVETTAEGDSGEGEEKK